jgi:UDP-N-acetylmuramoyl-tripeptide--D-alanyl-D-alanine ligase
VQVIESESGGETVSNTVNDLEGRHEDRDGDVVIALRGMLNPEFLMKRASVVIVCDEDTDLLTAARNSGADVYTVGRSAGRTDSGIASADFSASEIDAGLSGTVFILTHRDVRYRVAVKLLGEHQVVAVVAALAAATIRGTELPDAIAGVAVPVFAERWVMQPLTAPSGAIVINDAKEATYASMATSLKALALFTLNSRRSVAVLGALDSDQLTALDDHDSIGRLVVRLNIKKLVVVGHPARHIQVAAGLEGSWDGESVLVATSEEAYDLVSKDLGKGDVVLVKSSEAAGLRFFGDKLGGLTQ